MNKQGGGVEIAKGNPFHADVVRMLRDADEYYASLYPQESNHLIDVNELAKDDTLFFVAQINDRVIGCTALVLSPDYGELKRMYVDPAYRGLGVAQDLLDTIVQASRGAGLSCIRLETGYLQHSAIALYRKNSFFEIPPFGGYGIDPLSIFMQRDL
ncbi:MULTISPECIES: GNAT family N-acetyltransferase [unclassified Bradyrhizobium]|uniref:GNAT family N-acetyltransferase n=1 Tax=unclassified Bradyrhizobium TaxID=2631580 RepID=UPI0028E8E1AB|nr:MULTISPECIES: GNAT family N-acetyltransferase [unclassified Bradyrhizobium]